MSKKYKKSNGDEFFEVLVEASSLVPWWTTLPLSVILFYFIPFNTVFEFQALDSSKMVWIVIGFFVSAFFKYLLPMAFLFGAVINIFSSIKSGMMFKGIQQKGAKNAIKDLSWQDFEFLLSEWFKIQGFNTELTGGGGADGGIDIKLHKEGEMYLVQCKHYKAWKVSVQVVRELFGVIVAENAVGGYVVTSGKFTKEAYVFAEGKNIELIDGSKLEEILDSNSLQVDTNKTSTCPRCGSELVERSGKYGNFLGCSTYPKCKYTLNTDNSNKNSN